MLKILLTILIAFIPTIVESVTDLYRAKVKHLVDTHTKDIWMLRIPIIIGISLLTPLIFPNEFVYWVHFWQMVALSSGIFIMFFDPIMGIGLGHGPFYLGTTSKTDVWFKLIPTWQLYFLKSCLLITGVLIYFTLDQILG